MNCEVALQLSEHGDGSVSLKAPCPWQNCKHRFIVCWRPPCFTTITVAQIHSGIMVPPFKALNGRLFLAIQVHMKEEHLT